MSMPEIVIITVTCPKCNNEQTEGIIAGTVTQILCRACEAVIQIPNGGG